ncbi:MAG: hypothetical protein ABID87_07220 [Chloroflexota bacterium]
MVRWLKEVPRLILAPALVAGVAALALYWLGMVPDYLQPPENGPRDYDSIAAAEADLGMSIALPTYFPSYLAYPPTVIRGQREPVRSVQMTFVGEYGSAPALTITQTEGEAGAPVTLPGMESVGSRTTIIIGEGEGTLITGTGKGGQPLTGAYWRADGFLFTVVTTRSERELLTIIRSM